MSSKQLVRLCLAAGCGLALWGCSPSVTGVADEEKEPQFLIGRSRVNDRDYQGAIEAFEKALETNPRSAAAHFELGWLYAEKEESPAAAIHHYEKFLRLRPNADNAETIRQHIFRLKQELAKGVMPIPPSIEIQRQLEQMAEENRRLRDELDRLRAVAAPPLSTNRIVAQSPNVRDRVVANTGNAPKVSGTTSLASTERSRPSARVHQVQPGETPVAIARRYNVKLDSLLSVNPGLNPQKLRIGQSLVIPGR